MEASADMNELRKQLAELKKDNNRFKTMIQMLEAGRAEMKKENEELRGKLDYLMQRFKSEKAERDRYREALERIGNRTRRLLARLEAAESLLEDINYDVFACDDGLLDGWRAWRKAAGKENK